MELRERSLDGSVTRRYQSLSLDKSRPSISTEINSMFCPLTQNKKFEAFLDDLFDLNIAQHKMKSEIVNYMQIVESFYTDKLHKIRSQYEKQLKQLKKKHSSIINPVVQRSELEKIFLNALDELRK